MIASGFFTPRTEAVRTDFVAHLLKMSPDALDTPEFDLEADLE